MVGYYIVYVSLTVIYTFLNEESKKYLLFFQKSLFRKLDH